MGIRTELRILWTCPKCGRQFERKGQSHSCKSFAIELHFKGKMAEKELYGKLKRAVKKEVGAFKVESLECCIHFVSTFTFTAIEIMGGKLRVDFALNRKIKNKRIVQEVKMSAHRWLYFVDIYREGEIDEKLLGWIKEAHDIKDVKAILT